MIILIFGKRGSGKTCLCRKLIRHIASVTILDVFDEYTEYPIVTNPRDIEKIDKCRILSYSESQDNLFFETVRKLKNKCIVIEEVDRYSSPHYVNPDLGWIIRYGRHSNLNIIAVCRRPSEMSRHLTANADAIYSFRMIEPRDLDYFKKIDVDFAAGLSSLEQWQFDTIKL